MKQKLNPIKTEHFGIQRKIVANMTTESWETIPHVSYIYEPDVTEFVDVCNKFRKSSDTKITFNTIMMKAVIEGLKAAPVLNSHMDYKRHLVRGKLTTFKEINVSMPMVLPSGDMMTINLHDFQDKSLKEMSAYIEDVNRRVANTNLNEVMFDVSLDNTLTALGQGKLFQTLARLVGSKTGKHKVKTLSGDKKKEYYSIPEKDRLTLHDIEQGTVTITNFGSLYRSQRGSGALIEIVPPQVSAFAIGAIQDKAIPVTDAQGNKTVGIRKVMPITIVFDHRAVDFGDIIPFLKRLDNLFENPNQIINW